MQIKLPIKGTSPDDEWVINHQTFISILLCREDNIKELLLDPLSCLTKMTLNSSEEFQHVVRSGCSLRTGSDVLNWTYHSQLRWLQSTVDDFQALSRSSTSLKTSAPLTLYQNVSMKKKKKLFQQHILAYIHKCVNVRRFHAHLRKINP